MSPEDPRDVNARQTSDPVDAELDAILARCRVHPPTDDQLARMLRAMIGERPASRRRLLPFAAGLVSAAAMVALVWLVILPPNQPRALALGDVIATLRSAETIRTIYDDGEVYWEGHDRCWAYVSSDGVRIIYEDLRTHEQADFDAHRGEQGAIILRTMDPRDVRPSAELKRESHLDGFMTEAAELGRSFDDLWNRSDEVQDGQAIIHLLAKEQSRRGIVECVIDADSGMMLWSRTPWSRAEYAYPRVPLNDIYDLGVPRDTPVLDWRPTAELKSLRERVIAAQSVPLGAYRMVRVEIGRSPEARVFVTDGLHWRMDVLPVELLHDATAADLPQVARVLLRTHPCDWSSVRILWDGSRQTIFHRDAAGAPEKRDQYPVDQPTWVYSLPAEIWSCWQPLFMAFARDGQMQYLGEDAQGAVGVRIFNQATPFERPGLRERWFDPLHGYQPVCERSFNLPSADWQLRPDWASEYVQNNHDLTVRLLPDAPGQGCETRVLEWAQLGPGQWYPALREVRHLSQDEDGTWQPATSYGLEQGDITMGIIRRYDPPRQTAPLPSIDHICLLVEALEDVPAECFTVPGSWRSTPIQRTP